MATSNDKEVDQIIDGLTGDFRLGERYYIFTVTYAYIGHIKQVTDYAVHLEGTWIVSRAGSESDAVTKIVHGSRKPESYEVLNAPIFLTRQSIVAAIKMMK
jgi:hypothetical protein